MMKKITLTFLLTLVCLIGFGQTFDFNGSDGGWYGVQTTAFTQNANSVTLEFDADTDPKFRHDAAGITDPVTNGIVQIILKNNSSASEFRFVFERLETTGNRGVVIPITPNSDEFLTYYIDLSSDSEWDNAEAGGSQNALDFAFREPGGSSGDNSINNAGSIEIDKIAFISEIPREEKLVYEFNTDDDLEGWDNLVDATAAVQGGSLIISPTGGAIAKVTNSSNIVNADNNNYLYIFYKNMSATNNQLRIQFRSSFDDYSSYVGTNINDINQSMSEFETLSIDLASIKPTEWTGLAQDFQIAIRNTNNDGNAASADGEFLIDRIVFSNDATLSSKDLQLSNTQFYPNPANERLFIKTEDALKAIDIFDVTGKNVLTTTNFRESIDISTLNRGLYLVKITAVNESTMVKKLIKD